MQASGRTARHCVHLNSRLRGAERWHRPRPSQIEIRWLCWFCWFPGRIVVLILLRTAIRRVARDARCFWASTYRNLTLTESPANYCYYRYRTLFLLSATPSLPSVLVRA
ncbi:hypothetical protein BU23DRAFT_335204 [Bimuria novae-zelandiae CBS 107.79]|uniref:Uncharacterized protein n=1 Tax=Bimuria novae-zelandiae CBS 107.79 TaxID=1447943 RepID=A0A6A5UMP0_9PLEO|nr:hypothetical protein BU23DRAFT_335204 [Bimuria novae-zelandiae CBS 107.79]